MDCCTERKAFDETKTGVKGLVDSGIKEIPAMFIAPPATLASLKAPPSKLTIPTVDLKGGDRSSVVEKIKEAAEKWGFFQVTNHGIPEETMERMLKGTRGFHELEPEVKKKFYTRDHHAHDFIHCTNVDLFTAVSAGWRDTFFCYTAPDPPRSEDVPDILREIVMEYSKQVMKLGELIFEHLSEALGLSPNHLKDMDCAKSLMMAGQYYPPCPQPDLTLGISKHYDFSFITILLQGIIGGLQVLHDESWVDVPPVPGAIIVNIGDLLQLLSNDKFISAEHRVIANGYPVARVSVPFFFTTYMRSNPRVYGPIKELLSEDNLPKYRECSANEFLDHFSSIEIAARRLSRFRI